MAYKIAGYNEFYEGWLARVLEQPRDESKTEDWQDGWEMADETGPARGTALGPEIKAGHITVTPE